MRTSMTLATTTLFVLILLPMAAICLQWFLSKRESRWLGLILPGISLLLSLVMMLSVAVFDGMSGMQIFMRLAAVFLGSNIPTFLLLAIYFAVQEKNKRRKQLDRMNVQDLE